MRRPRPALVRSRRRNACAVITRTRVGRTVVTVAVRGPPVTSAISPRKSPDERVLILRPPRRTSAAPSTTTRNSLPLSPSVVSVLPAGRSTSSASEAISCRSRFESPWNNGTVRSSSTFASLRSTRSFSSCALAQVNCRGYSGRMPPWDTDALIVDAVRSPIGKKNGPLSHIRGDDLSAQVLNGLLARHDLDPAEIEDVQWGCVTQIDEQAWNIGRNVALAAGWPVTVCGTTVDRQCGSSMQTNFNAAAAVWSGQLDLVISGGVEMMSRVPMGSNHGSMSDAVHDRFEIVPQGISAEEIAERWNLAREELDEYSYESHMRAARAIDEGRFEREIVPIELDVPAPDEGGGT